jgi:hypothetical protein
MIMKQNIILKTYTSFQNYLLDMTILALFFFGFLAITLGTAEFAIAQDSYATPEFDDTLIRNAVGNIFALIEGAFGALIMVISGVIAIVAAAMGAYRAAVSMLIVAIGAFILRSLVSLFFGTDFEENTY